VTSRITGAAVVLALVFGTASRGRAQAPSPSPSPGKVSGGATTPVEAPVVLKPGAGASSPAEGLLQSARLAAGERQFNAAGELLERAVVRDPGSGAAWNALGWADVAVGRYEKAEEALRKAIAIDATDARAYNNLGQALAHLRRDPEAIAAYQKAIQLSPQDPWAHLNLGRAYLRTKDDEKAISELEAARRITPKNAGLLVSLGGAYGRAHRADDAGRAFAAAVALDRGRENDAAYEMALAKVDLPQAEKYAGAAITRTLSSAHATSLAQARPWEESVALDLGALWDTWGFLKLQEGALPEAERYLASAWQLSPGSEQSAHLGAVFEALGRAPEALAWYEIALSEDAQDEDAKARLAALAPGRTLESLAEEGRKLFEERTTLLVKNPAGTAGSAEFWVLLSHPGGVREVRWVSGADPLAAFEKDLLALRYPQSFPDENEASLILKGTLFCPVGSPECRFVLPFVRGSDAPAGSTNGDPGFPRASVVAPKKVKDVKPVYPLDAARAGLMGTVVLEVEVQKDGAVQEKAIIHGASPLTEAAIDAVKGWRYTPTVLNGVAVPVLTTVTVNFKESPPFHFADLVDSLKSRHEAIRESAARWLQGVGPGTGVSAEQRAEVMGRLQDLASHDPSARVRAAATETVAVLEGKAPPPTVLKPE
jgi:TonB family protein